MTQFRIPPKQFFENTHTIAVAELDFAQFPELPEDSKSELEALIERKLGRHGFDVLTAQQYSDIWAAVADSVGELFDSRTGERLESKYEAARRAFLTELGDRWHVDAVLYPELWVVDAAFSDGTAKWDGQKEDVAGFGTRLLDLIGEKAGGTPRLSGGTVQALSLAVFVQDLEGNDLYNGRGGIHILQRIRLDGNTTTVPGDRILARRESAEQAVNLALEGLARSHPSNKSP